MDAGTALGRGKGQDDIGHAQDCTRLLTAWCDNFGRLVGVLSKPRLGRLMKQKMVELH